MELEQTVKELESWLSERNIEDVEVIVGDFAGISRGKIIPRAKFVKAIGGRDLRMPDSLFSITLDIDFAHNDYLTDMEEDLYLIPDLDTLRVIPWKETPTASVICHMIDDNDKPSSFAPRQILIDVLKLYEEKGWKPIMAPEFEFFLIENQGNSLQPPKPASGLSGKSIDDKGVFSMDALEEFGGFYNDVKSYSKALGIPLDTFELEAGPGQFEANISHGEALDIADQTFYFKRLVKRAAIRHGVFATFLAKPFPDNYGSAMHIHQSIVSTEDGKNIFADESGKDTELFHSYIAGLQKYTPDLMPLYAPYTNSYLRFGSALSSPSNLHWGVENRSVGLRVPAGDSRAARRIENRIAGSDINPYLVFAASLLSGYLGIKEKLKPSEPVTESAFDLETLTVPNNMHLALSNFSKSKVLKEYLSEEFVTTYKDVKLKEYEANSMRLSDWEIRYVLCNV